VSLQVLGVLGVVAIYGVLFYLWYAVKTRRGVGKWLQKQVKEREIRHVESINLGMRTTLSLVEVKGKRFLVLTSPQGVQLRPVDSSTDSLEGSSDISFEKMIEEQTKK
jgi:hypothetical protein